MAMSSTEILLKVNLKNFNPFIPIDLLGYIEKLLTLLCQVQFKITFSSIICPSVSPALIISSRISGITSFPALGLKRRTKAKAERYPARPYKTSFSDGPSRFLRSFLRILSIYSLDCSNRWKSCKFLVVFSAVLPYSIPNLDEHPF